MTFHNGCKQDFEEVAEELDIDLTTWYVQALPKGFWEGFYAGNEIYNVNQKRAKRVWDRHKEFFKQFDVIVTSDTAPLSRIFLQNGWRKPLIVWVCNRFDYSHGRGLEERFPDLAYYELLREATKLPNVRFISYTPFEHVYSKRRGVDFGTRTIKPLGKKESLESFSYDAEKANSLLLFPRLEKARVSVALRECASRNIPVRYGTYDGPEDLKRYKGVLFFPYAFSNLALFEDLQRGIIHFVPTARFLTKLRFIRSGMNGLLHHCEWYFKEYQDVMVFFDSWDDLKQKVEQTDYSAMQKRIRAFGQHHREEMIERWDVLFEELCGQEL